MAWGSLMALRRFESTSDRARFFRSFRLRQVDVKAEHFERQLQRAEQERDAMEKKYEVNAT